jgi:putative endonuclease
MAFYTYTLASRPYGTLYTGSTDDLHKRVWEHQEKVFPGFTAKYGVDRLVWCESHDTRHSAFARERQIKKWNRAWKVRLIEADNPRWEDLLDPKLELHPDLDPSLGGFSQSETHPRAR